MTEEIDAAVRVTILPEASEKGFLVESVVGKLAFGTASALDQLIATQQGLPSELEKVKTAAGPSLSLDCPTLNGVLAELYAVGDLMLSQVLANDVDSISMLRQFFEVSFASLKAVGETPVVEMTSPRGALLPMVVPIELFPLLWRYPHPPQVTMLPELATALEGLLGFSAIIARRGREISRTSLSRGDALPMKLFQHTDLKSARAEMEFFTSRADLFDCEGPWPAGSEICADPAHVLAKQIAYPENCLDGKPRELPDQVLHFACHCDTLQPNAFDHSFSLRSDNTEQVTVTLRDLRIQRTRISKEMQAGAGSPRPLVFFNACGTAVFDPRGVTSFVQFFLDNGNRGFIGTQTPIPDTLAAKFCELFYIHLLRGVSVGSALHVTRRKIAERYNNPLGVLYVYYGSPELCVKR